MVASANSPATSRLPQTQAGRTRSGAAPLPHAGLHVCARGRPRRSESEHQACREGEGDRHGKHGKIERKLRGARNVGGQDCPQALHSEPRQEQPGRATRGSQDQALDDELPHEPCAAGAERLANPEFLHAGQSARQQQVRHVDARDDQQQPHRDHQHQQCRARFRIDDPVERRRKAHPPIPVRARELTFELRGQLVELGFGLARGHARFQPPQHDDMMVGAVFPRRVERQRLPHVDVAGESHIARRYADHSPVLAVQRDRAPDQAGIAAIPLPPQAFAEHDNPAVARRVLVRGERSAPDRPDAERIEEPGRHSQADHPFGIALAGKVGATPLKCDQRVEAAGSLTPGNEVRNGRRERTDPQRAGSSPRFAPRGPEP